MRIEFTVLGKPQPAGSKKAFVVRGRPVIVDDAKKSRPWKDSVAAAAQDAMIAADLERLEGPLLLEIDFYVARPAGHYGSGRNAGVVKDSAPRFPAVRPDVTKLVRGVEDAMTGLVWRDDAQVVTQTAKKRYGHPERAVVLVWQVEAVGELAQAPLTAEGLFA